MSIEDAFKVVISGGIVSPNASVLMPVATAKDRQVKQLVSEGNWQVVPTEED